MDFSKQLGANIREIRTLRGLSLQELSDNILKRTENDISANLISMWERGERKISAEQLSAVCKGLDCTPNFLFPGFTINPSDRIIEEFAALSDNEKEILEYAFTSWDGNNHALIQFIALYMSLPRRLRENIAFMGISVYEKGLKEGAINKDAPLVDIAYIEKQWKYLLGMK